MKNAPKVTVLMPVYNAEKFLGEAIESILNQTLTDFEFLIIDDASTDSSVEIIESYDDSRIRLINNEKNLGISATLNKGIEAARGDLIARMDADDISYPARLEKQFDYFSVNPETVLLATWAREIAENGAPLWTGEWRGVHYYYNLVFHCRIYHPTVMYRRGAVIEAGKYQIPYCEDYDLWRRISRKYKIAVLEETLLDYRLTDASLTRESKKRQYAAAQTELVRKNIEFYAADVKLSDNELDFLQNECDALVAENDLRAIVRCFKKFDSINARILRQENVNRSEPLIIEAINLKKEEIIEILQRKVPKAKVPYLLYLLGYPGKIAALPVKYAARKIRNIFAP